MSAAATSAARTTISSPHSHWYEAIDPSASDDALPLTATDTPIAPEYGPPGLAIGAALVEGGGGGVGVEVAPSEPMAASRAPRSAPGIDPPTPARKNVLELSSR